MSPDQPPALSAEAVLELARLEGYATLDAATAERLATGAVNATRAVTASVEASLFDTEPADFALELERLADRT